MSALRSLLVLTGCALLALMIRPVTAQETDETCPAIVETALDTLDSLCADTARNQVCYGNVRLEAEFLPDSSIPTFSAPGDVADVADLLALRLSGMAVDAGEWGVALMRLQTNLPGTLPGQNVTFVLFGDVRIEAADVTVEMAAAVSGDGAINVRAEPSTAAAVVATLASGESVTVTGRNAAADWLRIALPDEETGWVAAFLLDAGGDVNTLRVVDGDAPVRSPMQAIYLQTGVGDAPCAEAPASGVLVQTPDGARGVAFTVNGVDITLNSTAFLQGQAGATLDMYLLEGRGTASAFGVTQRALAGSAIQAPLGDDGVANAEPLDPFPYALDTLQSLPVGTLDREIAIAEPIDPAILFANCVVSVVAGLPLHAGPGIDYPATGTLPPDQPVDAVAQAIGTDGAIWFELLDGRWLEAAATTVIGLCDLLPQADDVAPPPEFPEGTPTPDTPSTDGGRDVVYDLNICRFTGADAILAGDQVTFRFNLSRFSSQSAAQTASASSTPSITINDEPLEVTRSGVEPGGATSIDTETGFTEVARAMWTAEVGRFNVVAMWSGRSTSNCIITVR
jgi:uncharacterized protein YraI